jgi:hypothetical protein
MKALFGYIKAQVNLRLTDTVTQGTPPAQVVVPVFKTIRMWNNQLLHSNATDDKMGGQKSGYKDEKAFPYPALFVEFQVEQTDNRSMGIKDYVLVVRFRIGVHAYKFERLDTFDFKDRFDAAIQLMAPTVASGLTFTTFQEIQTEFDEDWNNVEAPYVDYRVRYRSSTAYQRRNDVVTGPVSPVITSQIL